MELESPNGWKRIDKDEKHSTEYYFVCGLKCVTNLGQADVGDEVTVWIGQSEVVDGEETVVLYDENAPPEAEYIIEVDPENSNSYRKYSSTKAEALKIAEKQSEDAPWN